MFFFFLVVRFLFCGVGIIVVLRADTDTYLFSNVQENNSTVTAVALVYNNSKLKSSSNFCKSSLRRAGLVILQSTK